MRMLQRYSPNEEWLNDVILGIIELDKTFPYHVYLLVGINRDGRIVGKVGRTECVAGRLPAHEKYFRQHGLNHLIHLFLFSVTSEEYGVCVENFFVKHLKEWRVKKHNTGYPTEWLITTASLYSKKRFLFDLMYLFLEVQEMFRDQNLSFACFPSIKSDDGSGIKIDTKHYTCYD